MELKSPFFEIKNNELYYLGKTKVSDSIDKYILEAEGVCFQDIDKKEFNETVLVIEPHADDFALSALGYTYNEYNVEVLNIFSKTSLEYFTWNNYFTITEEEYEDLRIKESKFAVEEYLKEKVHFLREKSTRLNNDLDKVRNNIINKIDEILLNNKNIKKIMIPMGIGNHPDHIFVFNTIMNNIEKYKDYEIILYPEYPYARNKKAYMDRINELNNLEIIIKDIDDKIDVIANCISIYKSQFDDINRSQMLALIREDARALATEYKKDNLIMIYYRIGG